MAAGGVTIDDHGVMAAIAALARGLGDLGGTMTEIGAEVVADVRPLVPVRTGRLVDDLRAQAAADRVEVSIGTTPRVGEYARIVNAYRGRFMERGEDRAEVIGFDRVTDTVDRLVARSGLGV